MTGSNNSGASSFYSTSDAQLFLSPPAEEVTVEGGPGGVCDCHGSTIEWRKLLLPTTSASATSFLTKVKISEKGIWWTYIYFLTYGGVGIC